MRFLVKDVPSIVVQNYEENEKMANNEPGAVGFYSSQLEKAEGYGEVWKIVKETVKNILVKCRVGIMLFLDDLPLNLGAYHPVGTNNMVLNKSLIEIVEATSKTKLDVLHIIIQVV